MTTLLTTTTTKVSSSFFSSSFVYAGSKVEPNYIIMMCNKMATKATLIFVLIFSLSVLPGLVENLQCYSCANCQIKSPRLLPAVTCSTEQQFCVKMRFYFIDFMMSHHCAYSCEEFATSTFSVNCCTTDMCNHGNRTNIGPALLLNLLLNLFISFLF